MKTHLICAVFSLVCSGGLGNRKSLLMSGAAASNQFDAAVRSYLTSATDIPKEIIALILSYFNGIFIPFDPKQPFNGIFSFLATNGGRSPWRNPHDSGLVHISISGRMAYGMVGQLIRGLTHPSKESGSMRWV